MKEKVRKDIINKLNTVLKEYSTLVEGLDSKYIITEKDISFLKIEYIRIIKNLKQSENEGGICVSCNKKGAIKGSLRYPYCAACFKKIWNNDESKYLKWLATGSINRR